ncbi:MAG: hypothetical protein AAGG01_05370 [Planctomycetota bacterium]
MKVGSHHGGLAKVLVEDGKSWSQTANLLFAADDFMAVEPFIEHERDLRYLGIGALDLGDGEFVILEVNGPPGLEGFPYDVRWALAQELVSKL